MTATQAIHQKKRFIRLFHNPVTAWVILALSLTLTVMAYIISVSIVEESAQDRFHFRADEIEQAIVDRLAVYEQALQDKLAELQLLNEVTMGREDRIVELKREVNTLSQALERPAPYDGMGSS